jgi:hypothetical protein
MPYPGLVYVTDCDNRFIDEVIDRLEFKLIKERVLIL